MQGTQTSGIDTVVQGWLDNQFGQVRPIHLAFLQGWAENPVATFAVMGLFLFVFALMCRYILYFGVRLTGRTRMQRSADNFENVFLGIAGILGFVAGEIFFQNFLLSGLAAGLFVFVCTGAVLEGVVVNESSQSALNRR